jgi:hypothetical protein
MTLLRYWNRNRVFRPIVRTWHVLVTSELHDWRTATDFFSLQIHSHSLSFEITGKLATVELCSFPIGLTGESIEHCRGVYCPAYDRGQWCKKCVEMLYYDQLDLFVTDFGKWRAYS